MKIAFYELPCPHDALEPAYSAKTVSFHYDKHHRAYFDKTVSLIKGTPFADMTLEEIVTATARDAKRRDLFDQAAQLWNHDLFWRSMRPEERAPSKALERLIERDFGGIDKLQKEIKEQSVGLFGSGWAWLVYKGDKLSVRTTTNADNPLAHGSTALLALDIWEHAYYLDYRNRRPDFVDAFLGQLADWRHASELLEATADTHAARPRRRRA
jgi:Fe-Mn family superoxide dismutase